MEFNKISYFKGKPENILPSLLITRKHHFEPENKEKVQKEIIKKILGKRINKVRADNFIYARIRPTLIKLQLIEDDNNYKLTPIGGVVISHIKNGDYDFQEKYLKDSMLFNKYKNKISKVLIELESETKVLESIEELQKYPTDFVSLIDIMIKLKNKGFNPSQKIKESEVAHREYKKLKDSNMTSPEFNVGSRLKELLRYYDYFGLVIYKKLKVSLNKIKLTSLRNLKLLKSLNEITDGDFFNAVYDTYKNSLKMTQGHSYVPIIPDIQKPVCYELSISKDTFIKKLKGFPIAFEGKKILLSPPRKPKPPEQVIIRGRVLYYYLSIFSKDGK